MASTLPTAAPCCENCDDQISVAVPGDVGAAGSNGANGTDGVGSFSVVATAFAMPAEAANVSVEVDDSTWMTPTQLVYVQNAGYMEVQSKADSTHVTLKNVEDTATGAYTSNVAPTTVVAVSNQISPAGLQGPGGSDGTTDFNAGSPTTAKGSLVVDNGANAPSASLVELGVGVDGKVLTADSGAAAGVAWNDIDLTGAATSLSGALPVANGGTGSANAANARTALGLAISADVQAYDAFLTSIAALGTAADKMLYTTALNTAAEADLPAFGRTLVANTTAALARADLGNVLPRYGILGYQTGVDLDVTNFDYNIAIEDGSRYRIDKIMVENASGSLTTGTAGVYTGAGGAGTEIAAIQALAAITGTTLFLDLTLAAVAGTTIFTTTPLRFRVGTAQAGATASVWILGWRLD